MSAQADSKTPGGYGDTNTTAVMGGSGSSSGGFYDKLGDAVANGINRWIDVETYKQTGGQMPPQYTTQGGGKVQAINTGTQYTTLTGPNGIPPWMLIGGAIVVAFLVLRK